MRGLARRVVAAGTSELGRAGWQAGVQAEHARVVSLDLRVRALRQGSPRSLGFRFKTFDWLGEAHPHRCAVSSSNVLSVSSAGDGR